MLQQRLFLVLSFSIILSSVHSEAYKCADELKQGGYCLLGTEDPTNKLTTLYVKKCGKGEACKAAENPSRGGCYKGIFDKLGDENEKCKVNEECISGNCVDGKCKCLNDGEECKKNYQCKSTSYCSGGKCKTYSKAGEKCDDKVRESCFNGYVCGTSESETEPKCIAKYSIEDGTVVSDKELCKSGRINNADKKCISYTLTSKDCDETSTKCSYTTKDGKTETFMNCDTKSDGKTKACPELNGDLWDKYVTAYTKRLNKIRNDKDYNRYSSKWNKYLGDRDVSDAYVEWQYNVLLSDASDCVKDFFKQQTASSNFVVFNVMIMISFALILL